MTDEGDIGAGIEKLWSKIERQDAELTRLRSECDAKDAEIERLNNIINSTVNGMVTSHTTDDLTLKENARLTKRLERAEDLLRRGVPIVQHALDSGAFSSEKSEEIIKFEDLYTENGQ